MRQRFSRSLRLGALTTLLLLGGCQEEAVVDQLVIDVHRDANCGCCKDWIAHLEDNGFTVRDHVEPDMVAVKMKHGVPPRLASCHTALIDGRFVEGHVPAEQVLELRKRPDLRGLAVPGMPIGSPGMEMGGRQDAYEVIGLARNGREEVIARYPGN
ncbi:DUF411 domain-containing protein [Pseudomonas flexibilis]|uniref:Metal-binding protein n=1 Tax=Pseudomonas flexibilis TaxID=706570 RepID=A0A0B3BPX1_9PSED|nr:DUF411 domain-containing protein [Pseudomonas flexibilis]KHO66553.1 metal-binding protein [Pseudomonas flexibilis]SCY33098.1 Uncharacterized conserved protein [Pseudomonas flexibilis]